MRRRVVITGVGAVSPLGHSVESNWNRLSRGESGISRLEFQGHGAFPHCRCGSIKDFDPAALISNRKLLKLMNRESQLAFIAAQQALEQSGALRCYTPERIGAYLGTGLTTGDIETLVPIIESSIDADGSFSYSLLGRSALAKCNPLLSFRILPNMALSYVSIAHGIQGPNVVFNPWPGNTVQAIMEAKSSIESGEIDCALAGGCDSKCNNVGFLTLSRFGILSQTGAGIPFASVSDGIIAGEGAACIVLESFENATGRNAAILAELCGGSFQTDSSTDTVFPVNADLIEATMRSALDDAGTEPSEVDIICTSANGHPVGDQSELRAVDRVFTTRRPALTALSQFTGDLVAAGPGYSLSLWTYSLRRQESLPLAHVSTAHGRDVRKGGSVRAALINAFSLGTTKACMVLRNVSTP